MMEVSSKQQPDFSEDGSGIVRKALPNYALQCWLGGVVGLVRWRGTGQESQRRHCGPDWMGPRSWQQFRLVLVRVRAV